MANYQVNLTPSLINLGTEGSLDTSIVNGASIQRTYVDLDVVTNSGRKKVGRLKDGETFNDTIVGLGGYEDITAL
jgi:hypothetical protein